MRNHLPKKAEREAAEKLRRVGLYLIGNCFYRDGSLDLVMEAERFVRCGFKMPDWRTWMPWELYATGVNRAGGYDVARMRLLAAKNVAKHAGVVCADCGGPITESEYSYGQSACCGRGVVPEETYGQIDGFTGGTR